MAANQVARASSSDFGRGDLLSARLTDIVQLSPMALIHRCTPFFQRAGSAAGARIFSAQQPRIGHDEQTARVVLERARLRRLRYDWRRRGDVDDPHIGIFFERDDLIRPQSSSEMKWQLFSIAWLARMTLAGEVMAHAIDDADERIGIVRGRGDRLGRN